MKKLLINLLRWVLFLPCGAVGALIGLLLAHVMLWIFLLFLRIIIFIGGIMVPARDQVEDGSLYELIVGWIASLCAAGFPGFIFVMAAATIAPNGPTAKKVAAIIAGIVLVVLVVTGLAQSLTQIGEQPLGLILTGVATIIGGGVGVMIGVSDDNPWG